MAEDKVEHYPDGSIIQRYPKWITGPDGKTQMIVQTKKEHDEILGIKPVEPSKKEIDTKPKSKTEDNKPKSAWGE